MLTKLSIFKNYTVNAHDSFVCSRNFSLYIELPDFKIYYQSVQILN